MKFEHTKVMGMAEALRGMRNPLNSWDKGDTITVYGDLSNDSEDKLINQALQTYLNKIIDRVAQTYLDKYDDDDFLYDIFDNGDVKTYLIENCNMSLDNRADEKVFIGAEDLDLAQRLVRSGSSHRKFMRQIFVSVDITAPQYWWNEADTYKIATVANSTSKMHTLAATPITSDCFANIPNLHEDNEMIADLTDHTWQTIIDTCETLRQKYNETADMDYWQALIKMLPESWLQTRTMTMSYENIRNMYVQRRCHKLAEWRVDFCNWVRTLPYADKLLTHEITYFEK